MNDRSETLIKPNWLKVKAPGSPEYLQTRKTVKGLHLHTVCEEAHCPNAGECWSHGTATFLIMGELCSRHCRFCAVKKGSATHGRNDSLLPLDLDEPLKVAQAVKELGLKHAVITSVTRDDLADGGASHFAQTAKAIHRLAPECKIEFLIPDLLGCRESLRTILDSQIDILNHNLETVPRLYPTVRPQADYQRSLQVLNDSKHIAPDTKTKSGIMVGLGETREEILGVMDDLRNIGVDILTIGQYLRPSEAQLPVQRFVTPEEFKEYTEIGISKGFSFVESAPLVRSSYHAWKQTRQDQ